MLSLLLGLQVEASQTSKVLLTDGLVDGRSTPNALAVVVRRVRPPIGFCLHVAQDHVLDRRRQAGNLPRYVCLPAAPSLAQVLQNRPCLVLLDALGHHVQDVVHNLHTKPSISMAHYVTIIVTWLIDVPSIASALAQGLIKKKPSRNLPKMSIRSSKVLLKSVSLHNPGFKLR